MPGGDLRDGREVALEIVGELRDHGGRDREGSDAAEQQCVAVGLRLGDGVIADDESAAGPVLDDDGLAEFLPQLLRENARTIVGGAAGGLRDDELYGALGILRLRGRG